MKEKKYYLIYQITNNLNNKIYIGKHETNNLDDDYFGSGKYLRHAQEKYGLENFTKTILFYCANAEEMNLLEHCVVTPEFCQRDDVYNIMEGGAGGWDYVNLSCDYGSGSEKRKTAIKKVKDFYLVPENAKQHSCAVSAAMHQRIANMSDEERELERQRNSNNAKKSGFAQAFLGKHHTTKTRQLISEKRKANPLLAEKNGVYGKHWYYDPVTLSCTMLNEQDVPDGWKQGNLNITEESKQKWINSGKNVTKGCTLYFDLTNQKYVYFAPGESVPENFQKRGRPITDDEKRRISNTLKTKSPNGSLNPKHIQEQIEFLRPRYAYYLEFGFDAMTKMFDYPYSQQNFSMGCKQYLPEYVKHARYKKK